MKERTARVERNTAETRIRLSLNLDGSGKADIHRTPLKRPAKLFVAAAGEMCYNGAD